VSRSSTPIRYADVSLTRDAGMATRLTKQVVESATVGLLWDSDPKVRGFGLRVHPGGAKSFFINYRIMGRERRFTIGSYPTWSVGAARKRAEELRRLIDLGHDPAGEKRERSEAPTVQDLIDRFVTEHLPTKRGRARKLEYQAKAVRYRDDDEKRMLAEIPKRLGKHTKVTDIHAGDIKEMHRAITEARGPVRANRILGLCSKAFALSLIPRASENKPWRDAAMGNPCKGVPRNPEEHREQFFSQAELAAISDTLAEHGKNARGPGLESAKAAANCIRLIMLTGCRPREAMLARWGQFDTEPGFWIKPSAHMKAGRVHKLPLNPAALELIEKLRGQRRDNAVWLFPGQLPGEPVQTLWTTWREVRKRAGLAPNARIYDLRHTFASVGAGGGMSLLVLGKLLGHTVQATTMRYAHLADDPLREATNKIGAVISGAGKSGAGIVRIRE
jgi:integrase